MSYVPEHVDSVENQTTFLETINTNFDNIQSVLDEVLLKSGGAMMAPLDLNGYQLLNLPAPTSGASPARWSDVTGSITLEGYPIPNVSGNAGKSLSTDGTSIIWSSLGSGDLKSVNNLSDIASASLARTNIGLGSSATFAVGTTGSTVPLNNTNNVFSGITTITGSLNVSGGGTATNVVVDNSPSTSLGDRAVGYLGAPLRASDANYTLVLDDAGRCIFHSSASAHAWIVPPNSSVAFPKGTTISVCNSGSGVVTVTRGAGVVLRANGSGTDANQTLNQFFVKTLLKIDTDIWILV